MYEGFGGAMTPSLMNSPMTMMKIGLEAHLAQDLQQEGYDLDYPTSPEELAAPIFDATPNPPAESEVDKWENPFALFARVGEEDNEVPLIQREPLPNVASNSKQPKDKMDELAEKVAEKVAETIQS